MPTTYTPLATTTVGSATSTVTFSGISGAYTDLVLVISGRSTVAGQSSDGLAVRVNSDTGTNYSVTAIRGNGSAAASSQNTNDTYYRLASFAMTGATAASGTFSATTIHFMNYANTTTNKTIIARQNVASDGVAATVGLWRSTAAITSISCVGYSGNIDAGSTFSLYGVASAAVVSGAKATGGDVVATDGTYWYHAFLASGTFTPSTSLSCDVLVVAGGGGGSHGGGGAGGYRSTTALAISSSTTVTVGAGGSGGGAGFSGGGAPTSGSNSVFSTLTSTGGGYGGGVIGTGWGPNGASGGSGGGSGGTNGGNTATGGASSPVTSPVQGYAGGGSISSTNNQYSGGGGGASAVGANAVNGTQSGAGGAGSNAHASWATVTGTGVNGYYAGGGGGGNGGGTTPAGGAGGGGAGTTSTTQGIAGTANTGGGGGGGFSYNGANGAGGSGIVIVRYAV
jgi:hypothetical protein